jgi:CRP/FNR family transcriptional regulator, cyclic AMP receptor protein
MARGIPANVLRHFKSVPLFHSVSKKGLRSIVSAATELDVPADKVLVQEGTHDRDLFVIIDGTARVIKGGKTVRTLGEGDFFGELALFLRVPRSATVSAATPMTVMVLGPRELEAIMESEPSLSKCLLAALAERVQASEKQPVL